MPQQTEANPPKILLTGATGYIGGSVLTQLLNSTDPALANETITLLVRGESRTTAYSKAYGARVRPVLFQGIDDTELTTSLASKHDVVINMTHGFYPTSAMALIHGLAQRQTETGRETYMIQLSGASNLGDQPITKSYLEDREFDDVRDNVYEYEHMRESRRRYHQRTTELSIIDEGLKLGVKTLVMMPPTIFGVGTGLYNKASVQIPVYIKGALKAGHGVMIGDGAGEHDHVHVEDLASLYELAVLNILKSGGKGLPQGPKGIVFSANGRHTWKEVAQRAADACVAEGQAVDERVKSVSLEEGAEAFSAYSDLVGGDLTELELGLCQNSRTVASAAGRLGWRPTRGEREWAQTFGDDVKAVLQKQL